ncbi:MAG: fumarylacetoacetase [Candidatus Heimdallarchaeota archaeon]|nr:fumarylacetoacetase [Candidatus Heimdallarchaeota archaeon]
MTILQSFIAVDETSDFPIQNLPYGIFSDETISKRRVGVAIGDFILDLSILEAEGMFTGLYEGSVFDQPTLNAFMATGYSVWSGVRKKLQYLLDENTPDLRDNLDLRAHVFVPMDKSTLYLPVEVPEFTDFYSSYYHAFNVGSLIRGPDNALMDNWKHLPVAYHGRSSSIILSGEPIHRPLGQTKSPEKTTPDFGPTRRLDFELEMGFFVGTPNELGKPINIQNAEKHIFGMILINDWSARDVQVWEYRPLGPFLAKNFATSISAWVVPLQALEPFRVKGVEQDPVPLPYLRFEGNNAYNINLEVDIQSEEMNTPKTVTRSNATNLYWSIHQQLAHHTINGCNMRTGDLLGSGTISGEGMHERGSLIEITLLGKEPVFISDSEKRTYLEDGDTVILRGWCQGDGYRVGFGDVITKVLPALSN